MDGLFLFSFKFLSQLLYAFPDQMQPCYKCQFHLQVKNWFRQCVPDSQDR